MADEQLSSRKYLTAPNAFTLLRLCCIPVFLWLLFGRDDRASAAWLLGALGATDWVDGWLARTFHQTSEFGKKFDPTADRLLFIVGVGGIIIDGAAPLWFCWLVLVREVVVGVTIATATLAFGMTRFDVTWWGKTATFLLMFAFPGFLLGSSDFFLHTFFEVSAWVLGIPGLVLSYYTAVAYVPMIRDSLREGRIRRAGGTSGD
ncbi:MAG: CDP-diacylglycerol--glycerol-3-phosphate 3-phosphatidyltransferase [Actinomycetota bacterium]|jgi:cardiolipin synthase